METFTPTELLTEQPATVTVVIERAPSQSHSSDDLIMPMNDFAAYFVRETGKTPSN